MDCRPRNDRAKLKLVGGMIQEGCMDINASADSNAEGLQSVRQSPRRHSHDESIESISPATSTITYLKSKRPSVDRKDTSEDRDEACINRRIKETDSFYGCNLYKDPSFGDKSEAQISGVNSSSLREDASNEADFENSSSTNPGSAKGCFFLASSHPAHSLHSRGSLPIKVGLSENEDRLPDGSPNLELALGVKRKQSREGIFPSFTGFVDRKDPDGPPDIGSAREEDECPNASLSLCLSDFCFQTRKE